MQSSSRRFQSFAKCLNTFATDGGFAGQQLTYHFSDVFNNKVFQQVNRLCVGNFFVTKPKHHAAHYNPQRKETSITSGQGLINSFCQKMHSHSPVVDCSYKNKLLYSSESVYDVFAFSWMQFSQIGSQQQLTPISTPPTDTYTSPSPTATTHPPKRKPPGWPGGL